LLEGIEGPKVKVVGDRVWIDGVVFLEKDLKKIERIVAEYGDKVRSLVTMDTSYVGTEENIQVRFDFVEVNQNFVRDAGVNLTRLFTGLAGTAAASISTGGNFSANLSLVTGFNDIIKLEQEKGNARVHNSYVAVTTNGGTAIQKYGGDLFVPVSGGLSGTASLERVEFGTKLEVTPYADPTGTVQVKVKAEISSLGNVVGGNISKRSREVNETVNLRLGQSIAIAALDERVDRKTVNQAPGLGSIPILGNLFKSKRYENGETDGVIFITPILVTAESQENQQLKTGVLSSYEENKD
jgi:pilus assembly protein CpaC